MRKKILWLELTYQRTSSPPAKISWDKATTEQGTPISYSSIPFWITRMGFWEAESTKMHTETTREEEVEKFWFISRKLWRALPQNISHKKHTDVLKLCHISETWETQVTAPAAFQQTLEIWYCYFTQSWQKSETLVMVNFKN